MALSSTSRFSQLHIAWNGIGRYVSDVSYILDEDGATIKSFDFDSIEDHAADYAEDSDLGIFRTIYAGDGFRDADGNDTPITFNGFELSFPIGTPDSLDDLEEYGSFNPFDATSFDRWLEADAQRRGAHIRETDYSEDATTGRPRITSSIDHIPAHRRPPGTTYAHGLDDWDLAEFEDNIQFTKNFTADENVTAPNDHESVLAFLAWLEVLRSTGSAVGDNILTSSSFNSREYILIQEAGGATVTMEVSSIGHHDDSDTGVYTYVSVSFRRVSGELDEFDAEAIRTLLLTETADIPVSDEQEPPELGSTLVAFHASKIILPDDYEIGLHNKRLAIRHPSMGVFPMDGAHVRAIRFDDLDDIDGVTNGKYMPNDGHAVIHFGHDETTNGVLRYRDLGDMVPSEGADLVQRVHNVSDTYECTIQDFDDNTMMILKPFQQSGPVQCALEVGGSGGEILALNPPDRNLILSRGVAGPDFDDGTRYAENSDASPNYFNTYYFNSSSTEYIDNDAITLHASADPSSQQLPLIDDVTNWNIRGAYDIKWPGWVTIRVFMRIAIQDTAPSGELAQGNGPSLWIAEGGIGNIEIDHFSGNEPLGGTGAALDYRMTYRGVHEKNTRFVLMHRIPAASSIGLSNYDKIKMVGFKMSFRLQPEIRIPLS